MSKLTAEQQRRFLNDGYLVAEELFTDADLQPVIDEIDAEVNRRAEELVAQQQLTRTYRELGFERQLTAITRETPAVANSIWSGRLCGPQFFGLITHPRLLDLAQSLVGPEIIASSVYRLRPKVRDHALSAVPWHQDSGYFHPYCDAALVLTVWIPLVDATEERGCLWVVPGKWDRILHHNRDKSYLRIPETELRGQAIPVPVRKGGALLLTNRTPHASFENKTEIVRWSMDLRYQSAALPTNAEISRLPGEIVANAEQSIPVACYPPEADMLVRSRARPGEVVRDAETFRRIRESHSAPVFTSRWQESAGKAPAPFAK